MEMNFDDERLMISLLKFVSSMAVQFQLVDLYGNKKPSQLFDTTITTHHHVFTQLKKKKNKNFNRGIVGGGGSWKGIDSGRPVYDKKRLVIGFKKTFRFDEKNEAWIIKEYRLSDNILKALRLRGQIRHEEEFVVCRITRSVNVENSSSQCQETVKSYDQENQDLRQSSTAANVISNVNMISPVSLVLTESNVASAKEEEECSHNNNITRYHKQLDAYAALVLETMVPYIPELPQEDEADSIPLFCEDFYIGYTNLWS